MYKLLIISFAFLLTVACTKQRESQFAQGQGENLLSVASYDGKTFEIKTGTAIEGKKQAFSKAQQFDIKSKAVGEDAFSVVNYEVTDSLGKTLLGSTAIVGRPNTTYQGLIKVEQNYVKVYKVAKETDIPLSERTYATKLSGNMLAVPLIGYPITSKVSIDRAKNEYNEKGSTKIEKTEVDIANAKFFRVDMSKGEIFEPVQKTDVLPSSLFEGEWYYSETVTAAPEENSENLGFVGGYDQTLTPSVRIKFLSNETSLKVVNLNIDERLVKKEDVNFKTALTIPVSWKSYKVDANGQGMSEKEDSKVHWSKRPYIEIDFGKVESGLEKIEAQTETDTETGRHKAKSTGKRLVSLEVKDDYISFSLEDENSGRTRYSFLRANKRDYVPKRLFKEDKRIFGFFETEKTVVNNYQISRQEDLQKNIFISRFNPRGGKITFNFTKTTPQWIRPTVQQAVKYWDDAFKAAGVKDLDIVMDESTDVELGDLRYNAINVIENLTASNLFGFGPSVTDPFTGEIISATTNVHLTPIREAIIDETKNYIKMKLGLLQEGRSIGISSLLSDMKVTLSKQAEKTVSVASDYFPEMKGLKAYLPDKMNPNKFTLQTIDFRKRTKGKNLEFDIAMASGNIHADIEEQCPEVVSYVKELQSQKVTHNDKENAVLETCSKKLVISKFMGTLVHEMGHNFGLRHNFMGSNDQDNFWSAKETGTEQQVRSSTVMEYASFNEGRLVKPGKYDIAAIRFGYADAIELADGKITPLEANLNIAQNLKTKGPAHSFKFCTDEDVALSTDPMCQRHDSGVTPLEVVRNIIADYQASVETVNFRGDAIGLPSPTRLQIGRVRLFILPLLRFYEEWRTGLARYLGQDEQYLERFSEAELAAKVAEMSKDPNYQKFVEQYKPVADNIFNFFYQLSTMENRYCVLRKTDGSGITLQELETVRQQTYFNKSQSVASCADAANAGYWKDTGLSLVIEAGHSLNSFRFDLSDKAAMEPLDVIGTAGDRMSATVAISTRQPLGYDARFRSFAPSILDEPNYRNKMLAYILSRSISGVPGSHVSRYIQLDNPMLSDAEKTNLTEIKTNMEKMSFPMFGSEKELVKLLLQTYVAGINVPGKPQASAMRNALTYGVYIPNSQAAALKEMVDYAQLPGGGYFAVQSKNAKASLMLIQALRKLDNMKVAQVVDLKDPKIASLIREIAAHLPTTEELNSMTVQQMFEKLAPLKETVNKTMADKTNTTGARLVAEVAAILSVRDKVAEVKASGDPEAIAQIDSVLAAPFLKVAQEQLQMPGFPTVETYQKTIEGQAAAAQFYKENSKELDAQSDLLSSIMLTLGR